jgi:hypothetical protein
MPSLSNNSKLVVLPMPKPEPTDKTKTCSVCKVETSVAYRVRIDATRTWVFICYACLDTVKPGNPHYVYGGTWKGSRH